MKKCELCNNSGKIYCESDEATLCWDCDSKVHGANFLAAKHSRALLCHHCQSPTPWSGGGPKLGATICVCNDCLSRSTAAGLRKGEGQDHRQHGRDGGNEEEEEEGEQGEGGDDDLDCGDDDDEEDEENQVVPWMAPSSSTSQEGAASAHGGSRNGFSAGTDQHSAGRNRHLGSSSSSSAGG